MTEAEIRKLVYEILSDIAPETDPALLSGERDIREGLDIDSMDFLNFIIALSKRAGVAIP
jgi:acyl carrier protein